MITARLSRLLNDAKASIAVIDRCRELYRRLGRMRPDDAGALGDDLGFLQHQQVRLFAESVYALFERSGRRMPGQGLRAVRDLLGSHADDIPVHDRAALTDWLASRNITPPDTDDAELTRAIAHAMVGPILPMPSVIGVRILHDVTFDAAANRERLAGDDPLPVFDQPFPLDATAKRTIDAARTMIDALWRGYVE